MNELLSNLDALLVTNPFNIRYLTGFIGLSQEEREAYVLVTSDILYLFTHALYLEQAGKLVLPENRNRRRKILAVVEISREVPFSQKLSGIIETRKKKDTFWLGFEDTSLTHAEYSKLTKVLSQVKFIPATGRIEKLRQIKRPDEIENIKQAAIVTDKCYNYIVKVIKPGVTETSLAWEIEKYIRGQGAQIAFSPIVAFNENSSQPHYSPSLNFHLQSSTLVLLDFGAKVNGYCADMTRVVFLGKPTLIQRQVYETVLNAQLVAIDSLTRTVTTAIARGPLAQSSETMKISGTQLDRAAREQIEKAGFPPYPHSLGHNVGLAIHEGPRLSIKKDEQLKPGMVFTIEPAVYLEGKFGIRIEDTVLIEKDRATLLTKSAKELTVL